MTSPLHTWRRAGGQPLCRRCLTMEMCLPRLRWTEQHSSQIRTPRLILVQPGSECPTHTHTHTHTHTKQVTVRGRNTHRRHDCSGYIFKKLTCTSVVVRLCRRWNAQCPKCYVKTAKEKDQHDSTCFVRPTPLLKWPKATLLITSRSGKLQLITVVHSNC